MRLLGGWLGCVVDLIGCRKFGAYFCGVGLQNGGSENPNGEESREKQEIKIWNIMILYSKN
jgi:hypothetical protein